MRTLIAATVLGAAMSGMAVAEDVVINNGLAPPNPDNVLDDDTHASNHVYVRNVGCPPEWPSGGAGDPCPSPGAATEVELAAGGDTGGLSAYDSSSIAMSGGETNNLSAYNSSSISMTGGTALWHVNAYDTSSITMTDGSAWWELAAHDSSSIRMEGGYAEELDAYDSSSVEMTGGNLSLFMAVSGSSTATMSGGATPRFYAYDDSTATMTGGTVTSDLEAHGNSDVAINDGTVGQLSTYDFSTVTMSGGSLEESLRAYGNSDVTLTDGMVELLYAYDSASVTVAGEGVAGFRRAYTYESSSMTLTGENAWCEQLTANDVSTISMAGGRVYLLEVFDSSTFRMSGGRLNVVLATYGSSAATVSGGELDLAGLSLWAFDSSTIAIVGTDFEVDGVPVPYGDLTASTGNLTGVLASGEYIFGNTFHQGGDDCWGDGSYACTGTITLVPASISTPALSPWSQLTLAAGLLGVGVGVWRRRAAQAGSPRPSGKRHSGR